MQLNESALCPCCSGVAFERCCEPYLNHRDTPSTPEQLMRSRYTAFSQINIDYIQETMRGAALTHFSFQDSKHWAEQSTWLRLEVVDAPEPQGDRAVVEFKAYYSLSGIEKCLQERSIFQRVDSRWYYIASEKTRLSDHAQVQKKKPGRNDPCVCGSGKKYKKCCYGADSNDSH